MSQIRIDKFLADAGIGTRSQVKEYLKKGRVTVNGVIVKKPEIKITPESDQILFDGNSVTCSGIAYYMFHKPAGCVTAVRDAVEQTVMDYFKEAPEKDLAPVGRLDKDTEGFLLVTNDGALAHFLLSPKRHVEKTYYAKVEGRILPDSPKRFLQGIDIGDDKPTLPARLEILKECDEQCEILLTLQEGRFHQVKRMVEAVGGKVIYLKRVTFGTLLLDEALEKGTYRRLTEEEEMILKNQAEVRT